MLQRHWVRWQRELALASQAKQIKCHVTNDFGEAGNAGVPIVSQMLLISLVTTAYRDVPRLICPVALQLVIFDIIVRCVG